MHKAIRNYLDELKNALKDADKAVIQDAVWDAESHLRTRLEAEIKANPAADEDIEIQKIIDAYGSPTEVAHAYLQREKVVTAALKPSEQLASSEEKKGESRLAPWPSFFGIFKTVKAYTSLLYLLVSLPVGIFFFTWAVTGMSLSFGLLILIIGIPFAIAFLGTIRILALAEGRIVETLLDVRMPRRPKLLPQGDGFVAKLKNLLGDLNTWTSLAYFILHLPLGIFYFVLMVTGLSVSFALMFAPFLKWMIAAGIIVSTGSVVIPTIAVLVFAPILGFLLLILTMHVAFGLGRLHGFFAKYMLVQR